MKKAFVRLWRYCHTTQGLKVIRYTMVSVISAITSLLILTILFGVWGKGGRSHIWRELLPFWVMSITGIGFALYAASLAQGFANTHHLQHLARTVLVLGANVAAFGILWLLKFLILNRLFAEIADVEVGAEA
jgi:hypothetical protein